MLKRIIAILTVLCMLSSFIMLSGGEFMNFIKAGAEGNGYSLSNNRLKLSFEPKTGLCSVLDQKTSQTWTQYYALPPQGKDIYLLNYSDKLWDIGTASRITEEGIDAVEITASPSNESKVQMKFPAQTILPASYKLKLQYKFEDAKDLKLVGNFHFEKDGYGFLKTTVFDIASATETISSGDWQSFELDIPLSEFPAYSNSFLVYFIVQGGAAAEGNVILGKASLVGGASETALPIITNTKIQDSKITFLITNYEREQAALKPLGAEISLNPKREDEVIFNIKAPKDDVYYQSLNFPASFMNNRSDIYWMLPKDAGLYLPAYDLNNETNKAYGGGEFYAHMGFNMAFFGAVSNKSSDGYYAIIDDPALTKVTYLVCSTANGKAAYMPQLTQSATKDMWTKDRTVRFRFVDKGGYVGIAKEYRTVAKEKGYLVTFKEKAKTNPNILKGAGASRIDLAIDVKDVIPFFEKISKAGIKNVMIKFSGLRNNSKYIDLKDLETLGIMQQIKEKYGDYYLYEYECYRDFFDKDGEFKADPAYATLAIPYKLKNVNGMTISGWTDISGLSSSILCPTVGRKYLDYKMQKYPMDQYPFKARMFDTLATTSLSEGECYDENHPSDRLKCLDLRLDFVKYADEKYGLDNHTEGAAEYLIPYVNSGEGPLDIMANTGVGINSMNISPKDRIPLWELVYHDCFGIYYHWEHGLFATNPDMIGDDLFSLLYGERGMFLPYYIDFPFFEGGELDQMISRIKRIDNVTQKVKLDEMVSHSFLSDDGMVQKTVFASGVEVIVNFSDKTYTYDKGKVKVQNVNTVANSTSTSTMTYTEKGANGKAVLPNTELVIVKDNQNANKNLTGWIIGVVLFVLAMVFGEIGLMVHIKKKREQAKKEIG
jgi:hypothetical protein